MYFYSIQYKIIHARIMFPNCKYTVHTKLEWNVLSFFETIHKSTPLSLCPFCRLWPPCVFIYQYNLFASNFCRFLIHMLYVFHKACLSHPRILIVLHRHFYKYRDIFLTPKNFRKIENCYQKYFPHRNILREVLARAQN